MGNKLSRGAPRGLSDPRWIRFVQLHRKFLYMRSPQFDFRTTEIARAIGVTRRTIQRWMQGMGSPKEKHLGAIDSFIRSHLTVD